MRLFFGIAVGGTQKFTCALRFRRPRRVGVARGRPRSVATHRKHTWRERDAMNSFVLAQLHAAWRRAPRARVGAVAARADGGVEQRTSRQRGLLESLRPPDFGGAFIAVAPLSTAADALSDADRAGRAGARAHGRSRRRLYGARRLRRREFAVAGHHGAATLAAPSAVSVLLRARAARAERALGRDQAYRPVVVYGAAVLCTVTWLAQPRFATVASNANSPRPPAAARRRAVAATPRPFRHTHQFYRRREHRRPARSGRPPRCAQRRPQLLKIEGADARLAAADRRRGKRFPGDLSSCSAAGAAVAAAAAADAAAPAPAAAAAAADALRRRPSGKPRVIRVLSLLSLPTAALGLRRCRRRRPPPPPSPRPGLPRRPPRTRRRRRRRQGRRRRRSGAVPLLLPGAPRGGARRRPPSRAPRPRFSTGSGRPPPSSRLPRVALLVTLRAPSPPAPPPSPPRSPPSARRALRRWSSRRRRRRGALRWKGRSPSRRSAPRFADPRRAQFGAIFDAPARCRRWRCRASGASCSRTRGAAPSSAAAPPRTSSYTSRTCRRSRSRDRCGGTLWSRRCSRELG